MHTYEKLSELIIGKYAYFERINQEIFRVLSEDHSHIEFKETFFRVEKIENRFVLQVKIEWEGEETGLSFSWGTINGVVQRMGYILDNIDKFKKELEKKYRQILSRKKTFDSLEYSDLKINEEDK